jgi:hypothetical protein
LHTTPVLVQCGHRVSLRYNESGEIFVLNPSI